MARAYDVAQYLAFLATDNEPEPDPLTHLRLQKLLYYVQGWSLALRGKPMFQERIEAWAHGPVVPYVFQRLRDFGSEPFVYSGDPSQIPLDDEEASFVKQVWDSYKEYSASSLRNMTHSEAPWITARGSCGPGEKCDAEITHDSMRAFFSQRAKEA